MGKKPRKSRAPQRAARRAKKRSGGARSQVPHTAAGRRSGTVRALVPQPSATDSVDSGLDDCVRNSAATAGSVRDRGTLAPAAGVHTVPDTARQRRDIAEDAASDAGPRTGHRGCAEALSEVPPALAVTYWGEVGPDDTGGDVSIRVVGVRNDPATGGRRRERFDKTTSVSGLPPGRRRFALTTRIDGIPSGVWDVTATRTDHTGAREAPQRSTLRTRAALFAHGPAGRLWSWPLLVGVGAALALVVHGLLLAREHANVAAAVTISVLACLLGFAGAKAWFLVLHRRPARAFLTSGACIQGFLLVAFTVLAVGAAAAGIGAGIVLDATTPGLFLGMAIGRPGCFLTGCCAGRPTASRWGLWSSDRRLAVRRVPVQLWEAGAALVIGATTLTLTLTTAIAVDGALFVGAVAAYTAVRQLLFPFRADPHTRRGRYATIAICVAIIAADVTLVALR